MNCKHLNCSTAEVSRHKFCTHVIGMIVMEKVGRGMSSCKCNISACVAFIAQSVGFWLGAEASRGDFPQWNLMRWRKQKACWLNQHNSLFQLRPVLLPGALQWQSERHESLPVPKDIHLSPGLFQDYCHQPPKLLLRNSNLFCELCSILGFFKAFQRFMFLKSLEGSWRLL